MVATDGEGVVAPTQPTGERATAQPTLRGARTDAPLEVGESSVVVDSLGIPHLPPSPVQVSVSVSCAR